MSLAQLSLSLFIIIISCVYNNHLYPLLLSYNILHSSTSDRSYQTGVRGDGQVGGWLEEANTDKTKLVNSELKGNTATEL